VSATPDLPLWPDSAGHFLHNLLNPEPQPGAPYTHTIVPPEPIGEDEDGNPVYPEPGPAHTLDRRAGEGQSLTDLTLRAASGNWVAGGCPHPRAG